MELFRFLIGLLGFVMHSQYAGAAFLRGRDDMCVSEGGQCVTMGSCTGWVDSYDISCKQTQDCCKPAPSTVNPEPDRPNNDTCGLITRVPRAHPMLRIVGGDPALEGEWPWQVAFFDNHGDYFCSGTLITPHFVVTAAHCFVSHSEADTIIVLGEHHLQYNTSRELQRRPKTIVKHGQYAPTSHAYDIAFIQLDAPVDISSHYVRTACFGSRDMNWTSADHCYSSGWGYTKDIASDNRHLQHVPLNLVNTTDCAAAWGVDADVNNDMVCAGNGQVGTCQGDSGGPLVCYRNGQYHLVGVTSFGHYTCKGLGYPDVFTRMSSYLDWMTSYMLLLLEVA